jgi:hypothetical protein
MKQNGDGRFELDEFEIALAMEIADRIKLQLAAVVQTAIEAGGKTGIPDQCVMSAIATETLLLAACCHNGTTESFRSMVEMALVATERFKSYAATDERGAMQ